MKETNIRYGATDKEILEFGLRKIAEGTETLMSLRKRMFDIVEAPEEFAKALLECCLAIEDLRKAI